MSDDIDALASMPWWSWLAAAVVLLVALRAARRPRPKVGEVWFAHVPFRDGNGSKDRPVLVLSRRTPGKPFVRWYERARVR